MSWSFWGANTQKFFGVIKTILMPIISIYISWYLFRFKFICWFFSFFNFICCFVHFIFSFIFLKAFCHIFAEVLNIIKYLSSQCMIGLYRSFINLYLCITPHTDPCGSHRWPAMIKLTVILLYTFLFPVFNQILIFFSTLPLMPHQLSSLRSFGVKVSFVFLFSFVFFSFVFFSFFFCSHDC